jgi:hypothetical protein
MQNISYIATTGTQGGFYSGIPCPINDIGASGYSTDIKSGNIFNGSSTGYAGCFVPPEYRSEISAGNTNGAGIIYKTNSGNFVYVQFASGASFINPQEISKGVVKLNSCIGNAQIIDTNYYNTYNNYSGAGLPFYFNYTNSTSSLAYCRLYNAYSSSLDYGLLYADPSITNINAWPLFDYFTNKQFDSILWNGITGAYVCNIGSTGIESGAAFSYLIPQYGSYIYNQNVPPGNDAIYWANGYGITMPFSSAVQTPDYAGYMLGNLLPTSKYKNFFTLKGNYYVYDGSQIYLLPYSNGVGSVLNQVPQPLVNPYGLQYLTASCDYAFFLDTFDNSIWLYSGARAITKGPVFCQKAAIQAGWYNDYDNALYLQTANSIITVRDDQYVMENPLPYSSGTWNTFNTNLGVYYVQGNQIILRTYENVTNSSLIPLNYQTGFLGLQSSSLIMVDRIKFRLNCGSGLTSTLNLTWNWITQDSSGMDISTINTSGQSPSGYFTYEWLVPDKQVTQFSVGIQDISGIQKLVILDIDVYITYVSEANISNKVL